MCVCVCVCVRARAHARTRVVPRLWLVLVSLPTRTFPFRTRPRPRAAGAAQEATQRMRTAALMGKQKAAMAANGFDVNSGTNLDITGATAALGEQDALTIRNNAARTASGYVQQGQDFGTQAGMLDMQRRNAATAGTIGGAASLLGGASAFADKWTNYESKTGKSPWAALKGLFD